MLLIVIGISMLCAASVTLNSLSIAVSGGGYPTAGSTIIITMNYTAADIPEGETMTVYGMATGVVDQAQVKWYPSSDGTGTAATQNVSVIQLGNDIIYDSEGDGYTTSHTATFTLPAPPSSSYKSFKAYGRVYAATSDDEFTYLYSGSKTSGYLAINSAPVASSVVIDNPTFAKVGQTLTGSYSYSDADSDAEGTTTFRWLSSSTENGTYTAISGATTQSYTVTLSDATKYLKFEVTPVASAGASPGTVVLSAASSQVTGAALVEIDASTTSIQETSANAGSLGSGLIKIKSTNTTFKSSIDNTHLTLSGLNDGLTKGAVTWVSSTEIRLAFTGSAVAHEYAASVNNITITVAAGQLEGVSTDKTTPSGFNILFINNPPTDLSLDSVGNAYTKITWNEPDGLKESGSGLSYYNIIRNDSQYDTVELSKGKGTYYYTDSAATNGTMYRYKIQAVYSAGTNESSAEQKGTPLAITAFSFASPSATGTIDHENKTIKVIVPNGTNLTTLIASFTATGATVKVGGTTQVSGSTSNDFSSAVVYVLTTSQETSSTCSYTVTLISKLATPVPESSSNLNQTTSSFTAKWGAVTNATGYRLDVSTASNFSSFLSGYENLAVGDVISLVINNLSANSTYYYRLRATGATEDLTSDTSTSKTVTTTTTGSGTGDTYIVNSDAVTINIGNYATGSHGTITPYVIINPTAFSPSGNDLISVSISYGSAPEGLQFNLSFDNPSIGNGTVIISYAGLDYDPTDIGYRISGGELHSVGGSGIDTENKTITFNISGLSKSGKAAYEFQIVANDESGQTLPVVLSTFTAIAMAHGTVRIDWVTQSETGVQGFYLLRNTDTNLGVAQIVSPIIVATNTSSAVAYSYEDREIPSNGIYYYWLQIADLDGMSSFFGPIAVLVTNSGDNPGTPTPIITTLKDVYPNPFNPDVFIPFDLATKSQVSVRIYNAKGQLIRTLLDQSLNADTYTIKWDGRDDRGYTCSTGVYFIKMQADKKNFVNKAVLLK